MFTAPFTTNVNCRRETRHVVSPSVVAATAARRRDVALMTGLNSITTGHLYQRSDCALETPGRQAPANGASSSCGTACLVAKPVADRRFYEYVTVGGDEAAGGVRFLLVSDSEAVFAAACMSMQAGYFDDPHAVPGFAHWLEHAVHLGSGRYPDDKDYKYFLSQHGGTSNASTGMVHTSYHFTVSSPHLAGALDRMARFFIDPLLQRDSILKEAENVHAEFSRNCNSDARKLLQLRRSAAGGLLGKFSTGNAATLLERPAAAGRDVPAALAAFWRRRYLAGALCGCVVGPQGLEELRRLVEGSFAGVRVRAEGGEEGGEEEGNEREGEGREPVQRPAAAAVAVEKGQGGTSAAAVEKGQGGASAAAVEKGQGGASAAAVAASEAEGAGDCSVGPGGGVERYRFEDMCGPGRLGRLFRVASQRELRQLEVVWYLPYGMLPYMRSKPWRWAGHLLGHEGRGSLAALLRGAGLVQDLTTGPFDEVRLGRGFMFWGVTLTLSDAGMRRVPDVLKLVFATVKAMRSLSEEQRRAVWEEVSEEAAVRWHFADRTPPLELAKDVAQRLHYFQPQAVLSGPALMYEYDSTALERFLSYLTPDGCNVFLSDSSFAGSTTMVEQWYGARYSEEPLKYEWYDTGGPADADAATATADAAAVDPAGTPDDSYQLLLSRLRLPPPPSWALPVDVRLVRADEGCSTAPEPEEADAAVAPSAATTALEREAGGQGGGEATAAQQAAAVQVVPPAYPVAAAAAVAVGGGQPAAVAATAAVAPALAGGAAAPTASFPVPMLLVDDTAVRLWHRCNVSFGVPKTHVYVHLITREVYRSPAAWVTARLACRVLDELLQPDVYDAQLVGTRYNLSCSETGLALSFHGFSGVVARLAEVVVGAVAELPLEQVQSRYGLVHGKLLRSLRLWRHNNPAQHAEYGAEHMLQLPHWHAEESIEVLEKVAAAATATAAAAAATTVAATGVADSDSDPPTAAGAGGPAAAPDVPAGPRAVWELLRRIGRGMAMEVVVYGNSTEQQARDLCATLERHLRPTGLATADGWPATEVLQLVPSPLLPEATKRPEEEQDAAGIAAITVPTDASAATLASEGTAAVAPYDSTAHKDDGSGVLGGAAGIQGGGELHPQVSGPSGTRAPEDESWEGPGAGSVGAVPPAAAGSTAGSAVLLRYVPTNPNPTNSNSAVYFLCQIGEDDPQDARAAVLLDLLVAVASKPAFHELRTRQRLGYAVSLVRHRLGGVMGLAVRVQSPDRRPNELRERVAAWLRDFEAELRDLAPERLASFKSSLRERYLEPPRSLADAAVRAWQPVRYRSYAFDRRARKAEALEALGLEDLVAFYRQHARPAAESDSGTTRVLCCEVWGGACGEVPAEGEAGAAAAAAPAAATSTGWRRVGDVDVADLHRQLPHYCHSTTQGVMQPLSQRLAQKF